MVNEQWLKDGDWNWKKKWKGFHGTNNRGMDYQYKDKPFTAQCLRDNVARFKKDIQDANEPDRCERRSKHNQPRNRGKQWYNPGRRTSKEVMEQGIKGENYSKETL